ncbi:NEAT domain-containing protein [Peptoniphilus harei]|uniref:NEAT domain-containing protein n=1 Tax=Peptoniphilus harei TaxID=54005 RepID=UPI002907A20F|nr:NEAT domain-containing protein [Peptoniphilus harei]MDU5417693.1 NEAT domain-containing protein [Peptoniphilus harei]
MKNKKIYIVLVILITLTNFVFASGDVIPEKEEINLEDGYYEIPVKLWHSIEDKESMGNKALIQRAEIEVKNKEANLYIGSDKMEYMSITASLVNIYFQKEDGIYHRAEAACYDLEVPKEKDKRPSVFRTNLINMDEMTKVYLDPKVEPMGDEPIRARIKMDFDKIKKINESEATLIKKFKDGPKKPEFNSKEAGQVENKNLIVSYEPDTFEEEFYFYGNKLSGKEAENYTKDFDKLDQVNVFKVEFLGQLDEISGDEKSIQAGRKKIEPKKDFDLQLPLLKFTKDDKLTLYEIKDGEKVRKDYKVKGNHIELKTKEGKIFILVKSANPKEDMKLSPKDINETSKSITNGNAGPSKKAQEFMKKLNKPRTKLASVEENKSKAISLENFEGRNQIENIKQEDPLQGALRHEEIKRNIENKDSLNLEKTKEVEERESPGIILLIILVFIGLNVTALLVIKKNFAEIKNMKEEIIFLGGLKDNEKNNK